MVKAGWFVVCAASCAIILFALSGAAFASDLFPPITPKNPLLTVNPKASKGCERFDLPPGTICVNGMPQKLVDVFDGPTVRKSRDLCTLLDLGRDSGCYDNIITEMLPWKRTRTAAFDPCSIMDLTVGTVCVDGQILSISPVIRDRVVVVDRCALMETAVGTECSNGIVRSTLDQMPPKMTSEPGDDWKERENLIEEQEKLAASLSLNDREKNIIEWRELGAYLRVVASFEFERAMKMSKMSLNPVSVWKGGKEIFGGAFSIAEKLDAVRRQFDIERSENAKSRSLILARKSEVDAEINKNEARRDEANQASKQQEAQRKDAVDRRAREDEERQRRDQEASEQRRKEEAATERRELDARRRDENLAREWNNHQADQTSQPHQYSQPENKTPPQKQDTPVERSPEPPLKLGTKG